VVEEGPDVHPRRYVLWITAIAWPLIVATVLFIVIRDYRVSAGASAAPSTAPVIDLSQTVEGLRAKLADAEHRISEIDGKRQQLENAIAQRADFISPSDVQSRIGDAERKAKEQLTLENQKLREEHERALAEAKNANVGELQRLREEFSAYKSTVPGIGENAQLSEPISLKLPAYEEAQAARSYPIPNNGSLSIQMRNGPDQIDFSKSCKLFGQQAGSGILLRCSHPGTLGNVETDDIALVTVSESVLKWEWQKFIIRDKTGLRDNVNKLLEDARLQVRDGDRVVNIQFHTPRQFAWSFGSAEGNVRLPDRVEKDMKLGVKLPALGDWQLSGRENTRLTFTNRLADAFGIDADWSARLLKTDWYQVRSAVAKKRDLIQQTVTSAQEAVKNFDDQLKKMEEQMKSANESDRKGIETTISDLRKRRAEQHEIGSTQGQELLKANDRLALLDKFQAQVQVLLPNDVITHKVDARAQQSGQQ
jgi:hypothetical protein